MSADCNIGIYEEQDEIMKGNSSSCTQYGSPDKRRHCLYPHWKYWISEFWNILRSDFMDIKGPGFKA